MMMPPIALPEPPPSVLLALNDWSERLGGREMRLALGKDGEVKLPRLRPEALGLAPAERDRLRCSRVYLLPGGIWPGIGERGGAWLAPWAGELERLGVGRAVPVRYQRACPLLLAIGPFLEPFWHWDGARVVERIEADLRSRPLVAGEKVYLLGHSYGGYLATEVAPALQSRGRRVEGVMVLETHLPSSGQYVKAVPKVARYMEVENEPGFWLDPPAGTRYERLYQPNLSHTHMVLRPTAELFEALLRHLARP